MKNRMRKDVEEITPNLIEECCRNGACKVTEGLVFFNQCENLPFAVYPRKLIGTIILLCLDGKIHLRYNDKDYELLRNDCIVLSSLHIIEDYSYSQDCRCIAIYGTSDFLQEAAKGWHGLATLFVSIRSKALVSLSDKEVNIFKGYSKAIQDRVHWVGYRFLRQVSCLLFTAMVLDLGNLIWGEENSEMPFMSKRCDKLFTDFIYLVEKNFHSNRRVSWYAGVLNITPKYLSEMVKSASGQTPNEWIDKYVVMELRSMLRDSALSVKEISDLMHFPNQSFLGKYFKQHTGMSPSAYRKKFS
jgi:AraC family transcriptional activator of pobA